ncbi:MAG: hypothetical protein JNM70_14175 [Anaerolineae bacterium]|nr:hypothetical protein [Anaerolineae bacterium]
MSIALAATFNPRGEVGRLRRFYARLKAAYEHIVISLPPVVAMEDAFAIRELPEAIIHVNEDWSHGRFMALQLAAQTQADYVHYADMDRLLRWVETRPDEWTQVVSQIVQADCLVIGRTDAAWQTHPHALRDTEAITNDLFSRLLGQRLDLSAGSKGFSRSAMDFILANSQPRRAIGTDSEWIVLLHRGGFRIETVLVDGLDWEIADQHQDNAADSDRQKEIAALYDADPKHWARRVEIAHEIVEAGMDAMTRELRLEADRALYRSSQA